MTVTELYQRVVLEHNRAPRRFGRLERPTHAADRANARCGDHLHCELDVRDGRIADLRFDGEACAVAVAAASMLGELACGASAADVAALGDRLRALWQGAPEDPALGELNALSSLARFPERRHCAELPFAAIAAALREGSRVSAMHCCFRDAVLDDVDAVVELVESAYRGDASRQGWTTEADLLDGQRTDPQTVRALIQKEGSRVVLAEREGELVACAHLDRHDAYACGFGMFSVRPQLQGRGIGNALIRECERRARAEWRCRVVDMSVIRQREDLIPFYERRGYRRTGATKPFPYGNARFGQPKRADLEFIVLEKAL